MPKWYFIQLNRNVGTRRKACSLEFAFGELEHAARRVHTKQNPGGDQGFNNVVFLW